ncbi:ECF family sigma factor [Bordetella ansorpii]|uniref:ECF family sigma factor n=1 Tax=Bordetella ansorpii TaxID=288768 RepID=A0A157SWH7_9BORD|nr:ECF family sigma factor [Bordetella ansorpii]
MDMIGIHSGGGESSPNPGWGDGCIASTGGWAGDACRYAAGAAEPVRHQPLHKAALPARSQHGQGQATKDVCGFVPTLREVLASNYALLQRRLQRRLDSEDLASDCLHEAWLRLGDASVPASIRHPQAYVYRVACNVAMDMLRTQRPGLHHCLDEDGMDALPDAAPGPETVAQARSGLAALERAMDRLPAGHRTVLSALRLEDQTRTEVADRHGMSLRRVDTVLRQALDYCAQACGETVRVGVSGPRRALPRRWRRQAEAGLLPASPHAAAARPRGVARLASR